MATLDDPKFPPGMVNLLIQGRTRIGELSGGSAWAVWTYLVAHLNFKEKDGLVWPSMAKIAEDLHKSRRTVIRAIKELEDKGWLEIERRKGKHSIYHLHPSFETSDTRDIGQSKMKPKNDRGYSSGVTTPHSRNVTTPVTPGKPKILKEEIKSEDVYVSSKEILELRNKMKKIVPQWKKTEDEINKRKEELRSQAKQVLTQEALEKSGSEKEVKDEQPEH